MKRMGHKNTVGNGVTVGLIDADGVGHMDHPDLTCQQSSHRVRIFSGWNGHFVIHNSVWWIIANTVQLFYYYSLNFQ